MVTAFWSHSHHVEKASFLSWGLLSLWGVTEVYLTVLRVPAAEYLSTCSVSVGPWEGCSAQSRRRLA